MQKSISPLDISTPSSHCARNDGVFELFSMLFLLENRDSNPSVSIPIIPITTNNVDIKKDKANFFFETKNLCYERVVQYISMLNKQGK